MQDHQKTKIQLDIFTLLLLIFHYFILEVITFATKNIPL